MVKHDDQAETDREEEARRLSSWAKLFDRMLKAHEVKNIEIAEAVGVDGSHMSTLRRAKSRPSRELVVAMADFLSKKKGAESDARALVSSWDESETPPAVLEELQRLRASKGGSGPLSPEQAVLLSAVSGWSAEELASAARLLPEIREVGIGRVSQTVKLFKG